MAVRRIVAILQADNPNTVRDFYKQLLGLEIVMDHGWIMTFAGQKPSMPQFSVASEGGSGAPVPNLSIEVDDVDETYNQAKAMKLEIVYELSKEPWGVRRFFVQDPLGNLLNILSHTETSQ